MELRVGSDSMMIPNTNQLESRAGWIGHLPTSATPLGLTLNLKFAWRPSRFDSEAHDHARFPTLDSKVFRIFQKNSEPGCDSNPDQLERRPGKPPPRPSASVFASTRTESVEPGPNDHDGRGGIQLGWARPVTPSRRGLSRTRDLACRGYVSVPVLPGSHSTSARAAAAPLVWRARAAQRPVCQVRA